MSFPTVRVEDDRINRIQDAVNGEFARTARLTLEAAPVVAATIVTSDTRVFHGLGRRPRGWIVVGRSAPAHVYDGSNSTEPSKYINLVASAPVAVKLVFF